MCRRLDWKSVQFDAEETWKVGREEWIRGRERRVSEDGWG